MDAEHGERWIGRRIGAYEIVSLIGSGGMGEVYRARRIDAEYDKEVAIKLVPQSRSAFGPERLRAERQILAKLDHPHIARLIDGGATEDGVPYLIMDLVEGVPLDQYCEQRKLPVRDRLRLFRDVCAAVSYAHQHLVIHRDLKPHNILVTGEGVVKLLDFGIAKLVQPTAVDEDDAGHTLIDLNEATLGFASPEQVSGGSMTTATDVYSLGVVLFQLLTRRRPYRTSFDSLHDAMREICETQPPRPSAVVAASNPSPGERLNADIDAIILRALRKEPERRYRSVEELSQDIANYLDGRPVLARDGQFAYHAGKFVRRNRWGIAAGFLIVAALVIGIITSVRQARLAAYETARAERHVGTVRAFADAAMFQLHDAIKDLPNSTGARQLLVKTALEYLNALSTEAGQDGALRYDLATAYMKVAEIQGKVNKANTGEPNAALDSYAKAIALLEPLVAENPANAPMRGSLAQSYLQESRLLVWTGEPKKAVGRSKQAIAIYESLLASKPDIRTEISLADACRVHGVNLVLDGSMSEAVTFADRSVAILEKLRPQRRGDLDFDYELGVAYGSAADIYQADTRPGAMDRAYDLRLKALEVDERLVKVTGGRNASYARSLLGDRVNLCSQHNDTGEYDRAVAYCQAAQPLLVSLRTDENNAQIELDGTSLRVNLGGALLGAGRLREAAEVFDENVKVLRKIVGQSDTLQVQYLLAASEEGMGSIEAQMAANARSPRAEQLRRWRTAKDWFSLAVPRFENVAARISLTDADKIPMNKAIEGLKRSQAEIAKLENT